MPNVHCTNFSNRRGSPFQKDISEAVSTTVDNFKVSSIEKNRQVQAELIDRVNKKSAEIALNKSPNSDGVFTEVTTHGAFTITKAVELNPKNNHVKSSTNTIPKSLLGFPSSANNLALEAKADLESDASMSSDVKEKVITKLFLLANMVQHMYESKIRIASDFEKFKDKHLKDEARREKEHSEQLYKISMNFQNEIVQMIQQMKVDIDASKGNINVCVNDKEDDIDKNCELLDNNDFADSANVNKNGIQQVAYETNECPLDIDTQ